MDKRWEGVWRTETAGALQESKASEWEGGVLFSSLKCKNREGKDWGQFAMTVCFLLTCSTLAQPPVVPPREWQWPWGAMATAV
jgi:hypothetical protein